MKATLEFNLPEDDEDLADARKGSQWKWAMDDLSNYLRSQIKHADHTAEEYRIFERVYDRLYEILDDRDLRIHS
jgi:FKBP-type peptidyl-prolyl cis-trans isomerase (trigger factor)